MTSIKNSILKWYVYGLFFFGISALLFGIWRMQQEQAEKSDLNEWLGEYVYSESYNEAGYQNMMMDYCIRIYESDHDYFADIIIDGQTTLARIKAKVYGGREWISLVFLEYLPDHMSGGAVPKGESVLISFRNDMENIYTYWGTIEPMLYENQDSGKERFVKVTARSNALAAASILQIYNKRAEPGGKGIG